MLGLPAGNALDRGPKRSAAVSSSDVLLVNSLQSTQFLHLRRKGGDVRQRLFGPLLDDPPPFAFAPSVLAPSYCAGLLDRADDERPRLTTTRDSDDPPPPPQTSLACGTPASSDVLSMSKVPCATFRLSAGADARRHWMRALLTTRTFVRASRACRRCLLRAWSAVPAKCMLQGTEAVPPIPQLSLSDPINTWSRRGLRIGLRSCMRAVLPPGCMLADEKNNGLWCRRCRVFWRRLLWYCSLETGLESSLQL